MSELKPISESQLNFLTRALTEASPLIMGAVNEALSDLIVYGEQSLTVIVTDMTSVAMDALDLTHDERDINAVEQTKMRAHLTTVAAKAIVGLLMINQAQLAASGEAAGKRQ
tara:strand:- start:3919 stop:4254 length:336 start_codon:yes stop_codon:yes gene_type:complete